MMAGSFDEVVANNGKCVYRCAWGWTDDRQARLCLFALNINDWGRLADQTPCEPRTCLGLYSPPGGAPAGATELTDVTFPVPNGSALDPFSC